MSHECQCDGPGQCPRFGRRMTARHHQICSGRTDPKLPPVSEATRAAYVARWAAAVGLSVGLPVVVAASPAPRPVGRPGTELKNLIDSLGLARGDCFKCKGLAAEMDLVGPAGCREHRDRIVARLRESKSGLTWAETLRAAGAALLSGLAFRLDPRDVAGSLFDEAVRRAEAAEAAGAGPA